MKTGLVGEYLVFHDVTAEHDTEKALLVRVSMRQIDESRVSGIIRKARATGNFILLDDAWVRGYFDRNGVEVWVPKSQVHPRSPVRRDGDRGDLILTEWIVDQNGLNADAYFDGAFVI